ncbi:BnaA01g31240D [Brassica napus]|uniref:BnaA01g31240D protein n=1 Tax=Brassica napus TaxID=3708 RepID=A0A078HFV3_BRANA|nr:BnaA01g31240D [Brassica napus]
MKGFWNLTSTISLTLCTVFLFVYNYEDVYAVPTTHLCRPEQRDALLQFKNEFEVRNSSFPYNSSFSYKVKSESWANNTECCNWKGITCDPKSGEVIELDLSSRNLGGQLHSVSSLQTLNYLTTLDLSGNDFSGHIPSSIGDLSNLTFLDLSDNRFSGQIPSIPSVIGNLSHLTHLDLSVNHLSGQIPSVIGNLSHLTHLVFQSNQISGQIPIALLNLTELSTLLLGKNQFTGRIPHNITSLSKLSSFDGSTNSFTGALPSSLFTLPSMDTVHLSDNQLNGILDLGNISSPPKLRVLYLGNNNLTGPISSTISKLINLGVLDLSHYKIQGPIDLHRPSQLLTDLYLSGCGITEFPEFIRPQNLQRLDLSNNKIKGKVPGSLWTLTYLYYLNLSNNSFTGFENATTHGLKFRIPMFLFASDNNFTGNIPSFICDLYVSMLDLSNNNFSGLIPRCINFKDFLFHLNLRQNRLHRGLPENIFENLRTLDVGHNQLTGKLPRSLIHFSSLEVLNVESNFFNDTFPFWLSSLPQLKVLVLRSNAFHGPMHTTSFPKLQIIDISHNHFNGALPSDYFVKWSAMSSLGSIYYQPDEKYMGNSYYHDSVVLMNKGLEMELLRILKIFRALDFSGNKFEGEIPRFIGLLKELHVLNLSNNAFTGLIPSSMGNLTALESLDLSQNQLSGEIPQELEELSFLSYMNFSHNQLVGLVPGGTQFRRQNCTSFDGNPGLSGPSLDEICRNIHMSTPHETLESEEEEEEEEVLSWIAVVIGVIPGFAFGWVIGYILFSYKPEWFMNPFVRSKPRRSSNTTH